MSKPLSVYEIQYIEFAAKRGHSAVQISDWTGRTPDIIRQKAKKLGLILAHDKNLGGAPIGNINGNKNWFRSKPPKP